MSIITKDINDVKVLPETKQEFKSPGIGEDFPSLILEHFILFQKNWRWTLGISEEAEEMETNQYILYRVRYLRKSISSLQAIINLVRGIIKSQSPTDYDRLIELLKFLRFADQQIIRADLTPTRDDDFLLKRTNLNGEEESYLTENFYVMIEDIEETFENLQIILIKNKLLLTTINTQPRRMKINEIF